MSHPSAPELQAGAEFYVHDINGANVCRFVYLHEASWLCLQRGGIYDYKDPLSLPGSGLGCLMQWDGVLGYLALLARTDDGYVAAGQHGYISLTRRLSASALARLLGRTQEEVRAELTDFVLLVDHDDAG